MEFTRRTLLWMTGAFALVGPALAHHGWRWTDSGDFELTGLVTAVRLGNPHGVLTIDADGEIWTAEIGQPWRNAQAGLTEDMLVPGTEVIVLGKRHADPSKLLMKAEAITIDGRTYVLYPDRV